MNPIFNTKNMFYDYFPHLPAVRMKNDYGLGFYEQTVIRTEIQKTIRKAYDQQLTALDLVHADVYGEIGEGFDGKFYDRLKSTLDRRFHDTRTWGFLDKLMKKTTINDVTKSSRFNSRMASVIGRGLQRNPKRQVNLKEALVAMFNYDLDALTGKELYYLTKIK